VAAAKRLKLDPAWSVREALRHIVRELLPRLQSGERGVIETDESKYVHRARVAIRRMRSALKLIDRKDETAAHLRAGLKRTAQLLGHAREWDVLLEDTLPPLKRAFGKSATLDRVTLIARIERDRARAEIRKTLTSPYYRALIAQLARWLDRASAPAEASGALEAFAAKSVRKGHRRLLRDGRNLAKQTRAQRHGVRLAAKRLRYTVEFFESLFGRGVARPCLRELTAVQDALGAAEDTQAAAQFFASLHAGSTVTRFAREWLAVRERGSVAAAQRALARLERARPFWTPKP
jgi:CHAD domain-containing protein